MQASPKHSPLTCQSAALPPIRHCKASATLKTHGVETAMHARSIAKEGLALTSIARTGADGASISSKLRDLTDREQEPTLTTISRRKDRRAPYAMERLSFEMEGVGFSTAAQSILNAKGRRTLLGRAEIGGRAAATLTAVGERSGPKCFMPSHVSAWANQSRYRGAEGRQWVDVDGQHCNGLPA